MAKLGIFGGTFNPPHIGHLICAQEARAQLGLDRVVLVPTAKPPHKEISSDPGPVARLRLCQLAVEGDSGLEASSLEVDRGGTSYTIDTLRQFREHHPDDELTLVLGGDVAQGLPGWREPAEILELAGLAVAERGGVRRADIMQRLEPLARADRVEFFDMPRCELSSSAIRRRVLAGMPVRYLVPESVRCELEAQGWYTKGTQ
ncbi:MAG TPA: nicotinate-nucleotide adenylyltransferase [Baekduia sp.]|nr:nicotinate-nucleotide adenylyltransferase [Baekduia sp.]